MVWETSWLAIISSDGYPVWEASMQGFFVPCSSLASDYHGRLNQAKFGCD